MIYADGQADTTKVVGAFREYANAPKITIDFKYVGWFLRIFVRIVFSHCPRNATYMNMYPRS